MKIKKLFFIFFISIFFLQNQANAQLLDSLQFDTLSTYTNLNEALKNPDSVIKLVLKKKKLKEFPVEISQFKNLQYLDVSGNKIKEIPPTIGQLSQLQFLNISKNKIEYFPSNISELKNLKWLIAHKNEITAISADFTNLEKLEYADFWLNNISYFPNELSNLKYLRVLDLRGILINLENQKRIASLLPYTKIYFSPPCKCT